MLAIPLALKPAARHCAVITPYKAQIDLLAGMLGCSVSSRSTDITESAAPGGKHFENGGSVGLTMGTVNGFQGRCVGGQG